MKEYQVIFREAGVQERRLGELVSTGAGSVQRVLLWGKNEVEVRRWFERFEVLEVSLMGPVIREGQDVFTREEAAVFLRVSPSQIDALMAAGKLPRARDGYPRFTRRMLEEYVDGLMGAPRAGAGLAPRVLERRAA